MDNEQFNIEERACIIWEGHIRRIGDEWMEGIPWGKAMQLAKGQERGEIR